MAVIGSGMAGLTAAYLCRRAGWQVTVFEAAERRGMDAHTLDIAPAAGAFTLDTGWVDVPLRVMSEDGWRTVLALCTELGVETFGVTSPVSYSWHDGTTWFRTGNLQVGTWEVPFVGSWRYLGVDAWRIGAGLRRLGQDLDRLAPGAASGETIASFFTGRGYHPVFWRGFLLPLLTTICTCREEYLLAYPAAALLTMVRSIIAGTPLRRLRGGTRALAGQLAAQLPFFSGSPVVSLREGDGGVHVRNGRGEGGVYERVVVAVQANHQQFLDADAFARERRLLQNFVFDEGELVVHRDTRCMPRTRRDWTPLNYSMGRDFSGSVFTVWVNPIEPSLAPDKPLFQTWNPLHAIPPSQIVARRVLQRAVVTSATEASWRALAELQAEPGRRVYFCGAWAASGVPLLESAVRSALQVTAHLGVPAAWDREPVRLR